MYLAIINEAGTERMNDKISKSWCSDYVFHNENMPQNVNSTPSHTTNRSLLQTNFHKLS